MTFESLPLTGTRVLEFTHAVMGPSAGLVLADLGAEVIRIEPAPEGDITRRLEGFGSGFYIFYNRNKKSLAVDLKREAGKEIVLRLLATADVLIENFAPNTMDNLGLGYKEVSVINPSLIYCSLKGFMEGPDSSRTALDEIVQMMSGLAYMTGPPGQPMRVGASIIDILGGTFGALSILAALRERDATGKGKFLQTGLFETAAYLMGQHMAYSAVSQQPVPPMPARITPWAVYRLFDTKDEQKIFIGITSDKHWEGFCKVFDRMDLFADERLTTNNQRIKETNHLHPILEVMLGQMTIKEIETRAEEAGIPYSPVARPEDLFENPQLNEGNGLVSILLPDGREEKLPRQPMSFNGQRLDLRLQAPKLGEHTLELLRELGYGNDSIDSLAKEDIIAVYSNTS